MELSKELTDSYLNEDYVTHLTYLVENGHTELDDLTIQEQQEVENAIKRNHSNSS
jgi:hypothetical protein